MATEILRFPYQVPRATLLLLLLLPVLSAALSVQLFHLAAHHDRFKDNLDALSLLVYRVPALIWLFAAGGAFTTVGTIRFAIGRWPVSTVVLTADSLSLPGASIAGDEVSIPYAAIQGVQRQNFKKYQTVTIVSPHGRRVLSSRGFANAAAFERFNAALAERLRTGRSAHSGQAPARPLANGAPSAESGQVFTIGELHEIPAGPRFGKRKGALLDDRERVFDRILQRCFDEVGLTPWNTGPIYIVNAENDTPGTERSDGVEMVLTSKGIDLREHDLDRPGSVNTSRFDDLGTFLRIHVGRWIEGISQRNVAKLLGSAAFQKAKSDGTFREYFERVKNERNKIEGPMRQRLAAFVASAEVAEASALLWRGMSGRISS